MNQKSDALLAVCEIQTFRSCGKGGQHVNKTESAVRIRHLPSGIMVISRDERSQHLNKLRGLENLREKLAKHNKKKLPRIPSRISIGAKMRRMDSKKKTGAKKSSRRKLSIEE